jgi:hypothetical protein
MKGEPQTGLLNQCISLDWVLDQEENIAMKDLIKMVGKTRIRLVDQLVIPCRC